MKKLLIILLMLVPMLSWAQASVEIDGIWYNINQEAKAAEVTKSSGTKYTDSITIPESVEYNGITCSVTSIGNNAFQDCSGLTSVTIPNSVTNIGFRAFYFCNSLTSVTVPNSVTSIGSYAFWNCSGLTSIDIPNSVTSIGDYAFNGTPWYANQPDGLVYAGMVAYKFKGTMPANTSITINEGTTEIASGAFSGCSGLTSVTIPNSVTSIGYQAFYGCERLTSVTIPNSVTSIGNWAFKDCSGLTSVTIGNSVTSIGKSAFSGCYSLTSIHITDIAAWCNIQFDSSYSNPLYYVHHLFLNGEEVMDLIIPNSVTSIGSFAFSGCSGLTSITIGNSVTSIGNYAFSGCSGIREIQCNASVPPALGTNAFDGLSTNHVKLYVPSGCKDAYAFAKGWDAFLNIIEEEEMAISLVQIDERYGDVEYYKLNGVKVDKPTQPGVYLVKKDGQTKMIVVKK